MGDEQTNAQLALDLLADAAYVESRGLIHVAGRMRHAAQRLEGPSTSAQEISEADLEKHSKVFWREWRKVFELAPPWESAADGHRTAVINGVRAALSAAAREA